jgi:predicted ATP-grasp superfamily ATP-dependent carboligase
MIKFYNNVDIKNADLLISFNSAGLSGNFASSLLINNNNFTKIGFYFSHYICAYASTGSNGQLTHNGEIYFNEEKKLLIINFFVGAQHYYMKKFFDEFMSFYKTYSLGRIIIYGGISSTYQNDEELRKKNIDVYYMTNENILIRMAISTIISLCIVMEYLILLRELLFIQNCVYY